MLSSEEPKVGRNCNKKPDEEVRSGKSTAARGGVLLTLSTSSAGRKELRGKPETVSVRAEGEHVTNVFFCLTRDG